MKYLYLPVLLGFFFAGTDLNAAAAAAPDTTTAPAATKPAPGPAPLGSVLDGVGHGPATAAAAQAGEAAKGWIGSATGWFWDTTAGIARSALAYSTGKDVVLKEHGVDAPAAGAGAAAAPASNDTAATTPAPTVLNAVAPKPGPGAKPRRAAAPAATASASATGK